MTITFKTTLKTAIAGIALALVTAGTAQAEDLYEMLYAEAPAIENLDQAPVLSAETKIGVARVDGGRLIVTPYSEHKRWGQMERALSGTIGGLVDIDVQTYIKNLPEIPMNGRDTDNKIDEIRMAASDMGLNYVLIYGVDKDALSGSFAGKALPDTGLSVPIYHTAYDGSDAKALLVNTFTGEVLGAASASDVEFGIRDLTFDVERMIRSLSPRMPTSVSL